jgi:hypothetical protein
MVGFFPRETIRWTHLEEPHVLRRLSITPWPLAIVAGVGVRLAHAALFGVDTSSWFIASAYAVILIVLACGALTAHVGNFTVRTWAWRVPLFALAEAVVEALASLALILVGVEPLGAEHATVQEWPAIALTIIRNRFLLLGGFGLLLAGAVQAARFVLYKPVERAQQDTEADSEVLEIATGEHVPPPADPPAAP